MPSTRVSPTGLGLGPLIARVLSAGARLGPAWVTIVASIALSTIGILAIDLGGTGSGPGPLGLDPSATRQLIYVLAGAFAGLTIALIDYRRLGEVSWILAAVAVGLLLVLLVPGIPATIVRPRNGARSWIDLGPMDLQPSELAKIVWAIALAWSLRFSKTHRTIKGLLPPAIITAVPIGLILLQPDLGTASLFVPALFAVLVAAGARLRHLALIVMLACLAAPAAYPLLKPHQKDRIAGLLMQVRGDASAEQDINYQALTAQRLAGAGGTWGTPEARARVLLRHNPLPERHNDMIYAVIVHRHGMVGGLGVLALYAAWIGGALWTAGRCREPFGRLLAVGAVGFVGTQVFINVGMNLGLVPIIGVTLPLLSHGGSSVVSVWMFTGLIASIAAREAATGSLRRSFEYAE